MLSLEEFRATKKIVKDFDCGEDEPIKTACVYDADTYIIVLDDGSFLLILGNEQYVNTDVSKLEEILYSDFYVYECN